MCLRTLSSGHALAATPLNFQQLRLTTQGLQNVGPFDILLWTHRAPYKHFKAMSAVATARESTHLQIASSSPLMEPKLIKWSGLQKQRIRNKEKS